MKAFHFLHTFLNNRMRKEGFQRLEMRFIHCRSGPLSRPSAHFR